MTTIYSGDHIYVVEQGSNRPYVTPDNKEKNWAGDIRYNCNVSGNFEVYTGGCWIPVGESSFSLNLSPEVQQTVDWAKKKMAEEAEFEKIMANHPGVRAAWEQLEIMKRLCQETESQ